MGLAPLASRDATAAAASGTAVRRRGRSSAERLLVLVRGGCGDGGASVWGPRHPPARLQGKLKPPPQPLVRVPEEEELLPAICDGPQEEEPPQEEEEGGEENDEMELDYNRKT